MIDRYRRQILLPEIGDAGQRALSRSAAVVVGVGAVGGVADEARAPSIYAKHVGV